MEIISAPAHQLNTTSKHALIALDQSSKAVGWVVFIDGVFESSGVLKPDPPDYDLLRVWMKDMIGQLRAEGNEVEVVVESVYLASYPVRDKKTGRIIMQPQAQTFKVLVQTQSHVWAATREMGIPVCEMTAFDAMKALTGINNIATKREVRKAAMIENAERLLGTTVTEHQADAYGLALAFLQNKQPATP